MRFGTPTGPAVMSVEVDFADTARDYGQGKPSGDVKSTEKDNHDGSKSDTKPKACTSDELELMNGAVLVNQGRKKRRLNSNPPNIEQRDHSTPKTNLDSNSTHRTDGEQEEREHNQATQLLMQLAHRSPISLNCN